MYTEERYKLAIRIVEKEVPKYREVLPTLRKQWCWLDLGAWDSRIMAIFGQVYTEYGEDLYDKREHVRFEVLKLVFDQELRDIFNGNQSFEEKQNEWKLVYYNLCKVYHYFEKDIQTSVQNEYMKKFIEESEILKSYT